MFFAKYIDEKRIIRCPKNGYVGRKAISNLERYFSKNPSLAKAEGYMEYVPLKTELCGEACYKIENGRIVEGVKENDC